MTPAGDRRLDAAPDAAVPPRRAAAGGWFRFHSTQPSPCGRRLARTRHIARGKWETRPSGASSRIAPKASGSSSTSISTGDIAIRALVIRPLSATCSLEFTLVSSGQLAVALHVADPEVRVGRDRDGVGVGAVVEVQGAPHPVAGPPVARTPGVVALAGAGELELLVSHTDRAADPARDLVAGRKAPLIRHAVGLPGQVEGDLDRLSGLLAKRRRVHRRERPPCPRPPPGIAAAARRSGGSP